MASVTRASVAGNIPVIIAKGWVLYRMPNLIANNVINFEYADGIKVGDTVQLTTHLTRIAPSQVTTGLTGGDGVAQGAEPSPVSVTFTQPTVSNVQLIIAYFYYGAVQLTQYAVNLAQGDLEAIFRQSVFDGLAVKIDATKLNLASIFTAATGTSGSNLGDEDYLFVLDQINAANAPMSDRNVIISTQELTNLMRIEKYVSKDYVNGAAITDAEIGQLYGFRVQVTSNVNSPGAGQHDMLGLQRDAIASQLRVSATPISLLNPNSIAEEVTVYAVWGDKVIRNDHGVYLKGK
jgi:hypothetical protein